MISFVRRGSVLIFLAATQLLGVVLHAQETRITLERKGQTIVLEPYAPNILRVTLSLKRESALAPPGYGLVGTPAASGWNASQTDEAELPHRSCARSAATCTSTGSDVTTTPSSSHDPSRSFSTHVFLPIQPTPACTARLRSTRGPVST